MNVQRYTHCEVTIAGEPVPGFSEVSYTRKRDDESNVPLINGTPHVYEASCTMTLEGEAARPWLAMMEDFGRSLERQRQLAERLERRMCYGGRKGRRAARRLRAMVLEVIRAR